MPYHHQGEEEEGMVRALLSPGDKENVGLSKGRDHFEQTW